MPFDAPNINALWAGLAVEELVRNNVTTFVLSPGSRSTPLTLAAAQNPNAETIVHFDERGAAFHALGYAKATGNAVALICTSGTAVANYYPAVVEASRSNVPLILLTADRPPELHDTQANQTIDQIDLFHNYARWSATLPCPDVAIEPQFVLTTIDQAVYRAASSPAGPVQINCMFREPLAPTPEGGPFTEYLTGLKGWFDVEQPYTSYSTSTTQVSDEALDELAVILNTTSRGLIVVGQLTSPKVTQAARKLIETLGWPTCPDVTSGLRLGPADGLPLFHHTLLSDSPNPEVILQLGAPVTSKIPLQFLEQQSADHYIVVTDHPFRADPAHKVSLRFESDIASFIERALPKLDATPDASWRESFVAGTSKIESTIDAFLDDNKTLNELAVARTVSREVPPDAVLYLGNSMPIRDADAVGAFDGAGPRVAANRGVSGIDGNIATAAGYANALACPVVAVLGDVAVLHDLNSLSFLATTKAPVVLVVVNNDGGGVFSFLPIADHSEHFEQFFGAPHGLAFAEGASMFNLRHVKPQSVNDFRSALRAAIESNTSSIIEIVTNREENRALHLALTDAIKKTL